MGLPGLVDSAFAASGPLSHSVVHYRPREGQMQMAQAIAQTMEDGGVLVVEAGTGVGKTYAYLVPALLSGERILVSTATKALQDQLFSRDVPRLVAALGVQARVALLKGRSSYLCLERLASVDALARVWDTTSLSDLGRVQAWAQSTQSGDLAELPGLDEQSALHPWITSTRDNCLGAQCPKANDCHVNGARSKAMAADVVVANHHLFFADLNIRDSGVAELLPTVHTVVFDEAHHLNDAGVQFLGLQLSTRQLDMLIRDAAQQGAALQSVLIDWRALLGEVNAGVAKLRGVLLPLGVGRVSWGDVAPLGLDAQVWQSVILVLRTSLQALSAALDMLAVTGPALAQIALRCSELLRMLSVFDAAGADEGVRWLEVGTHVHMHVAPLDIAHTMRTRILGSEIEPAQRKAWIFTSATLGHDANLTWFTESCGLEGLPVLRVESPFDYATQASLYIPPGFALPGDLAHSGQVAQLAAQGAEALGGRTMVLATTLKAMHSIAQALRAYFSQDGDVEVLVQGQEPKQILAQRFAQASEQGGKGCVLVASASFWEGMDVPGDALQLLLMDKLPFSPPDDPVVQARTRKLEASGKNAFKSLHLPQAAIALKQGAGRLIRRETDRGILVVCDVRLSDKGYGRSLLKALPPMRRLHSAQEYYDALESLTRTSTMDQISTELPW